jgi:Protein of unknown function (DUF2442)
MAEIARIASAEPLSHGVLRITWNDDYSALVDLTSVIAQGNVFRHLQNAENFQNVRIGEYGHSIFWVNERGEEIDFGTDSLRARAKRQAE